MGLAQRAMRTEPDHGVGIPDEVLLVAYGNGDLDAARDLTARLTPRVLGQAIRMLQDRAEAEDVTQEAMLRLWRVAPDWRQGRGAGLDLGLPGGGQPVYGPTAQTRPGRVGPDCRTG